MTHCLLRMMAVMLTMKKETTAMHEFHSHVLLGCVRKEETKETRVGKRRETEKTACWDTTGMSYLGV